jgi:hypothetical protein
MAEISQGGRRYPNQGDNGGYARGERVAYPSTSYRQERNNLFSVAIPSNWVALGGDSNSVTYAPEGAYGSQGITHGVILGAGGQRYNNLETASRDVVNTLLQNNSYLRQNGNWRRASVDGRDALVTTLSGRSPITGDTETVTILTTQLRDGQVFYMAGVAPSREYGTYQRSFNDIAGSLRLY